MKGAMAMSYDLMVFEKMATAIPLALDGGLR